MSKVHELTDSNFYEQIEDKSVHVLVDFWAEWCGPCRMLNPILEEISTLMHERLKIFKVNIEENPEVATKLGIRSIPALYLFKNGKKIDDKVGLKSKDFLISWLEEHISGK